MSAILDYFERIYVISLPTRPDRRRDMRRELERAGLPMRPGTVEFFDGIRPDSADGFPSRGAQGCFLSHQAIMKRASADRLANVLVLEDDLCFSKRFLDDQGAVAEQLRRHRWDIAYLGYHLEPRSPAIEPSEGDDLFVPYRGPIRATHFYGADRAVFERIAEALEQFRRRPPGHPDGGPMQIDGAFNTFRFQNPDVATLIARTELGIQRSSRSDITAAHWFDRVPLLRDLAEVARSIRGRSGGR